MRPGLETLFRTILRSALASKDGKYDEECHEDGCFSRFLQCSGQRSDASVWRGREASLRLQYATEERALFTSTSSDGRNQTGPARFPALSKAPLVIVS